MAELIVPGPRTVRNLHERVSRLERQPARRQKPRPSPQRPFVSQLFARADDDCEGGEFATFKVYRGKPDDLEDSEQTIEALVMAAAFGENSPVVLMDFGMGWFALPVLQQGIIGKSIEAIAKGSAGEVELYWGAPGSEVASGIYIEPFNRFGDIDENKWVWVSSNGIGLYLTAREC